MSNRWPLWWRAGKATPPPAAWSYVVEDLTLGDRGTEWAMAAAYFVESCRTTTGAGPTVRELFAHLLPESDGSPGPVPDDITEGACLQYEGAFRMHVLNEWHRRTGLVRWQKDVSRSLTVTWRFQEECRNRKQPR